MQRFSELELKCRENAICSHQTLKLLSQIMFSDISLRSRETKCVKCLPCFRKGFYDEIITIIREMLLYKLRYKRDHVLKSIVWTLFNSKSEIER